MYTYQNGWTTAQHHDTYPPETELSGKIVWAWSDEDSELQKSWDSDRELYLSCGPETSDEALSDYYEVDTQLEKILPFASIGDSENTHTLYRDAVEKAIGRTNVTFPEVKEFVEKILKDSGLVPGSFF